MICSDDESKVANVEVRRWGQLRRACPAWRAEQLDCAPYVHVPSARAICPSLAGFSPSNAGLTELQECRRHAGTRYALRQGADCTNEGTGSDSRRPIAVFMSLLRVVLCLAIYMQSGMRRLYYAG